MITREAALRSVGKVGTEAADPREVQALIDQIKEDFVRIQVVRNEIVRTLKAGQDFDLKNLVGQTREIHKRASRLRYYLIPEGGTKADAARDELSEIDGERIPGTLVRLCNTIHSFVSNPTLELDGTVDVEQAVKAARDLQTIVDLSDAVKRSAEKLSQLPK